MNSNRKSESFGNTKTDQELVDLGYTTPSHNPAYLHNILSELISTNNCALRYPEGLAPFDRDGASRHTQMRAFELIGPLITWALNHNIGRHLENLTPVAPAPRGFSDTAEQLAARDAVNSWQLEGKGAAYDYSNRRVNREILADLIQAMATGFHAAQDRARFLRDTADDLRALNGGETRPLFEAPKFKKMGDAFTAEELRFKALEHVAFRKGLGMKIEAALELVSIAFGADVTDWWRRDRASRTAKQVRRLEYAEARGKIARENQKAMQSHGTIHSVRTDYREFDDSTLRKNGAAYLSARAKMKRPKRGPSRKNTKKGR